MSSVASSQDPSDSTTGGSSRRSRSNPKNWFKRNKSRRGTDIENEDDAVSRSRTTEQRDSTRRPRGRRSDEYSRTDPSDSGIGSDNDVDYDSVAQERGNDYDSLDTYGGWRDTAPGTTLRPDDSGADWDSASSPTVLVNDYGTQISHIAEEGKSTVNLNIGAGETHFETNVGGVVITFQRFGPVPQFGASQVLQTSDQSRVPSTQNSFAVPRRPSHRLETSPPQTTQNTVSPPVSEAPIRPQREIEQTTTPTVTQTAAPREKPSRRERRVEETSPPPPTIETDQSEDDTSADEFVSNRSSRRSESERRPKRSKRSKSRRRPRTEPDLSDSESEVESDRPRSRRPRRKLQKSRSESPSRSSRRRSESRDDRSPSEPQTTTRARKDRRRPTDTARTDEPPDSEPQTTTRARRDRRRPADTRARTDESERTTQTTAQEPSKWDWLNSSRDATQLSEEAHRDKKLFIRHLANRAVSDRYDTSTAPAREAARKIAEALTDRSLTILPPTVDETTFAYGVRDELDEKASRLGLRKREGGDEVDLYGAVRNYALDREDFTRNLWSDVEGTETLGDYITRNGRTEDERSRLIERHATISQNLDEMTGRRWSPNDLSTTATRILEDPSNQSLWDDAVNDTNHMIAARNTRANTGIDRRTRKRR